MTRGAFGYCLLAVCLTGAFLTGLYTFRLFFVVFGGKQSEFVEEHLHLGAGRLEGPPSMVWSVSALALLATFGGCLQFAHVWHPLTSWRAPLAAPLAEASSSREAIASVATVLAGLAGIWVAYVLYGAKSRAAPKPLALLEHKFYWDELYAWLLYRPADLIAPALARFVERPVIGGSITQLAGGFRAGSRELGRVQNGLVRSYILAIASGVAVLAVVFLSTR